MILSISNIAWRPSSRIEVYSYLRKLNINAIEVAPSLLFDSENDPFHPSDQALKKVFLELKNFDLRIVSMQSLLFGKKDALMFGDLSQRRLFMEGMIAAINLAERMNIPNIVFGSPLNRNINNKIEDNAAYDIALETFTELGAIAASSGTSILIEPNPIEYKTNFINTMSEAISFLEILRSPGVKGILDIGSAKMNNEYADLTNLVKRSFDHLNHVHISEPYLEPAPSDFLEFKKLYNLLNKLGYKKALSIEMKSKNIDIRTIKKCLSTIAKINH